MVDSNAQYAVKESSEVQEIIENVRMVKNQYDYITRDLYRKVGMPERLWRKYFPTFTALVEAASIEFVEEEPLVEVNNTFTANSWNLELKKTPIHTLEELVEYCQVDLAIWECERFICNSWEMGYKDKNGDAKSQPLYQVKATFRKKQFIIDAKKEIEDLKKTAEALALIPKPVIRTDRKSGNMLEIALFDSHFGKLSWSRETGGEDYDIKIAQRLFLEAVEKLLDRAKGYGIDSILFIVGNDILHSDNLSNQTTRGTVVDCDSRYQKTFEIVRETVTKCIERFREIAPVTVKMVQGNHDELSVWHLGDSLSCLFKNYDDVVIDNEPIQRKYHQWGANGFMFIHGHTGKRSDYPLLFATERPDIFGGTKWREIHTGHNHQTRTEEFHGVRVRIIPSLSAADKWHSSMTFVGQQRVGEAYIFNKTEGLLAQFFYNAD